MAENQTKNYSSYVKEVVQKNFEIFTLKMSFLNQKPGRPKPNFGQHKIDKSNMNIQFLNLPLPVLSGPFLNRREPRDPQ